VQRERLCLKWFLRSFRLLKEYYHIVLHKIVVQAAADRAGVCLCFIVCLDSVGGAFNGPRYLNNEMELDRLKKGEGDR